eukprot:TRINITY_DN18574_c0_g1_i1.p1 TRINITY_DN18574_c0_g1~~TRINITY_DN18574_c0_g1_i1.p1  ORF type:complete len:593 (-),score=107.51 TRINITY_DN18574_c0_g1_i1:35-1813(-)
MASRHVGTSLGPVRRSGSMPPQTDPSLLPASPQALGPSGNVRAVSLPPQLLPVPGGAAGMPQPLAPPRTLPPRTLLPGPPPQQQIPVQAVQTPPGQAAPAAMPLMSIFPDASQAGPPVAPAQSLIQDRGPPVMPAPQLGQQMPATPAPVPAPVAPAANSGSVNFFGNLPLEAPLLEEQIYTYRDLDGELAEGGGDIFSRIDKNRDGVITKEEFLDALVGHQHDPELGLRGFGMSGIDLDQDQIKADVDFKLRAPVIPHMPDIDVDLKAPHMPNIDVDFNLEDIHMPHLDMPHMHMPHMHMPKMPPTALEKCFGRCDHACDTYELCCGVRVYNTLARICGTAQLEMVTSLFTRRAPWLFTLLCVVLFASPIMLTLRLSQDMQVRYWISDQLACVLVLPVLFAITQLVHTRKRAPNRVLVCLCLAGSCVFLLLLGDVVLLSAYRKANSLVAKDCATDESKRQLQLQWQNAQIFYRNCMEETAAMTGTQPEVAYSLYRIQDCEGYSGQLVTNPAWPYLGALEQTYQCGGWCTRSQPLWTFKSVKDSCSSTVADVLYNKVQWSMLQLISYTAIVLCFVSVVLIQAGPILRSYSIAW